jgi:3-oxoacyl-[acyl-carrier-protein] synthase III
MIPNIKITGTGVYAPGDPISNAELKKLTKLDFDEEKLEEKLGIKQRHIARLRNLNESTADFATKAARNALLDANIPAEEVDLIIVGTDTPEFITPATSILVQGRLQKGEKWTSTFDIAASCASFTIAFDNAVRIMQTDSNINTAVVIGVYNMPAFVRDDDIFGWTIFADGAGAIVIQKNKNFDSEYIDGQLLTDGTQWDYVGVYTGGTKLSYNQDRLKKGEYGLQNLQRLPGDRNVRLWPMVVEQLLRKAEYNIADIDHFLFTQINQFVIKQVMEVLNQPLEKTSWIMDKYGYTGSGCIPMAFHHAVKENKVKRGDKIVFMASGAGLAVGSNLFIY